MDLSRGWVEGLAVWGAGFPDVVSAVLKRYLQVISL